MKLLIKNGQLLTMKNEKILKEDILIENGKIVKILSNIKAQVGTKIYDAKEKLITPGLIDPHCHVGLYEEGVGEIGHLGNEKSDPVTPNIDAVYGINPMDYAFKEALQAGITTVVTGPGSANVIGGTYAALKTYGETIEDMIIKERVAMKSALGENPIKVYGYKNKEPMTRMAIAALFRETLQQTREYLEEKERGKDVKKDFKLEALKDVLEKNMILKIHAHRADDIVTALRIAKEFDINITIEHCSEGHLIAKHLKKANAKVILGPLLTNRSKYELKNLSVKSASILAKEKIEFALCTDHPVIPIQYHAIQAALTVREGVSQFEALKAITINAAKLTGIDERVGSIEEGKDADIVVWETHPFDLMGKPKAVFINGEKVVG